MKKYKIYCLKCPSTLEIRYIGITTQSLNTRLNQHIWDSKNKNTHKCNWISSLKEKPIIELVEEVNESNWEEREIYWINFYRNNNLTNTSNGGKGVIIDRKLSGKEKSIAAKYKEVLQFSLDKIFIREWISPSVAAKELNLSIKAIHKCCSKKALTNTSSGGFIWVYKDYYNSNNFSFKSTKDIFDFKCNKKVYIKDVDTKEIKIIPTIQEAAKIAHIHHITFRRKLKLGIFKQKNYIFSLNQKDIV